MSFPKDFIWGAAAASYQVEGAAFEDGKGESVWDMYCRHPEKVWRAQTGDVACDHYHRYREDVALMKEIGLQAYRLSISWPRVMPVGTGAVNEAGLAFYDRLVDELLAVGIQPWVTLFHWDYPYELYCRGGWLNPDSPRWFEDYAKVIVDRLSDRVTHWMTLNEPMCFVAFGHHNGGHAPGMKMAPREVMRVAHHALLAHGTANRVIRTRAKRKAVVGFAPCGCIASSASDRPEDIEAARHRMFEYFSDEFLPIHNHSWWSDPIFFGKYPEKALEVLGPNAPRFTDAEMKIIHDPADFYGANIYGCIFVDAKTKKPNHGNPWPDQTPLTAFDWNITPEALYWGPRFFYERYRKPIVITENGMSNADVVSVDGACHDPQRIDYTQRYLRNFRRAAADGVEVMGYMYWSIMDNFEWAFGYRERFGLIHVDFGTQQRTLKDSARWYADVIRTNGDRL